MRILFVGLADSPHVARWLAQIDNQGWDVHLFPSIDNGMVHPQLKNVTVHHSFYYVNSAKPGYDRSVKRRGFRISTPILKRKLTLQVLFEQVANTMRIVRQTHNPHCRVDDLIRVIEKIKPDIVHAGEFQHAGYLTLAAKQRFKGTFPPWIISDYGNDIYLFGRLKEHHEQVKHVLAACDYYTSECARDARLAQQMGLKGKPMLVIPVSGGFNIERCTAMRQSGPSSARRLILIKGLQHDRGRALVALRALAMCKDVAQGYEVAIHSPSHVSVAINAELLSQEIGIPIKLIPPSTHEEILAYHGQARVHIGLSISDAASTSVLEAMVMGDFPIQSCTACTDEWFLDGVTGLVVPAEDAEATAVALRRALTDDQMIDKAAEINMRTIEERLDQRKLNEQVINLYQTVYNESKGLQNS